MSETKQRLVDSFEKNALEKVKISLNRWKAQDYVDVRIFFLDPEGCEHATRKGLCVHSELLPRLIEALQRVQAILDCKGIEDPTLEVREGG